jgi:hypothetical protein
MLRGRSSGKQVSGGAPADQPPAADAAAGAAGEGSNSASAQGPLAQVRAVAAKMQAVAGIQRTISS